MLVLMSPAGPSRPMTPPNQGVESIPCTPERNDVIKGRVSKFILELRSTFEIFLKENVQLPLWQPPIDLADLADETREHIIGLKIPTISVRSPFPLLLLHNLGQPSHDAQLDSRVDGLFSSGYVPLCVP
jgi:hypothetical protein